MTCQQQSWLTAVTDELHHLLYVYQDSLIAQFAGIEQTQIVILWHFNDVWYLHINQTRAMKRTPVHFSE